MYCDTKENNHMRSEELIPETIIFIIIIIALSVQRQATGRMARVRFPARVKYFSLLCSVQIDSGAHPANLFNG
jgi:hypothetical protein